MEQSEFLALDDVSPDVAEGYVPAEGEGGASEGWKKNIYSTTAGPAADGGSTSSAEDLARFLRALRAGRLISCEATRLMLTPLAKDEEDDHPLGRWFYGMGCFILEDRQGRILRWGHTGEEDGVSCRVFYYPQHDLDVVILGNQSACAGKVLRRLDELVLME
jgi:CubicO group peptidase (beta-lactamase class C family)